MSVRIIALADKHDRRFDPLVEGSLPTYWPCGITSKYSCRSGNPKAVREAATAIEPGVDDYRFLADIQPQSLVEYRTHAGVIHPTHVDMARQSSSMDFYKLLNRTGR